MPSGGVHPITHCCHSWVEPNVALRSAESTLIEAAPPKFPWPPLPETPPAPQARICPLPRCKREPRHRGDAGAQEQATRMGGAYPVALVTETARLLRLLISTIRWWRGVRRFTPKRFFS